VQLPAGGASPAVLEPGSAACPIDPPVRERPRPCRFRQSGAGQIGPRPGARAGALVVFVTDGLLPGRRAGSDRGAEAAAARHSAVRLWSLGPSWPWARWPSSVCESANFSADKSLQDTDRAGASRLDRDRAGGPERPKRGGLPGVPPCVGARSGLIWGRPIGSQSQRSRDSARHISSWCECCRKLHPCSPSAIGL
jgi:hypothetical protein